MLTGNDSRRDQCSIIQCASTIRCNHGPFTQGLRLKKLRPELNLKMDKYGGCGGVKPVATIIHGLCQTLSHCSGVSPAIHSAVGERVIPFLLRNR